MIRKESPESIRGQMCLHNRNIDGGGGVEVEIKAVINPVLG